MKRDRRLKISECDESEPGIGGILKKRFVVYRQRVQKVKDQNERVFGTTEDVINEVKIGEAKAKRFAASLAVEQHEVIDGK